MILKKTADGGKKSRSGVEGTKALIYSGTSAKTCRRNGGIRKLLFATTIVITDYQWNVKNHWV